MNNLKYTEELADIKHFKGLSLKKLYKEKGSELKIKDVIFGIAHGYDGLFICPSYIVLEDNTVIHLGTHFSKDTEEDVVWMSKGSLDITDEEFAEMDNMYYDF